MTRRQHVAISYGLLAAILLAALYMVAERPLNGRFEFFDRLNELRAEYARTAASIADNERLAQSLEAEGSDQSPGVEFLEGGTAALAAAELQNRLKLIIEGADAVLVSSAFRGRTDTLPVTAVTVAVRLRSSMEGLMEILYALESNQRRLFIENLSVQSRHRPGRALQNVNEALDVEFDVTGFLDRPSE